MLLIGDRAPDFEARTSEGPIRFHEWMGSGWAVLFSHPKYFRPVCATELAQAARLKDAFAERNARLIALCINSLDEYERWRSDIKYAFGTTPDFPVIDDDDKAIAAAYGVIHPNMSSQVATRTTYIIGPDKTVRAAMAYPSSLGRDFRETLRALTSLQLTEACHVATPAEWTDGEDVIIVPQMTEAEARQKFPSGWKALRPYLRIVPQPDMG
ncbi:MAG: redoxin domain-containing protein [Xanthobacteraceae bacterium]|nr:redoxin domain-containing protein [Xanthobacteraceae bacterium]